MRTFGRLRGDAHLRSSIHSSIAGLKAAWKKDAALRRAVILAMVLVPSGLWLGASAVERALLVASALFVLTIEILNCALETTVDRIGSEENNLTAMAKDLGAAASLLSVLTLLVIWGLIIYGRVAA